jgi:serine/threonine protein kinase
MGGLRWVMNLKNLVQRFGFGISKRLDENPKEDETSEMHLVMELMDSNLSSILKEAKGPLPYHLAIDIMHQIAKGVYYLHDMQVAHLDLKPDNVLSSSIPMEDLDAHRIFKVMDYGTCQLEVLSNLENPEPSKYTIGTLGYMSPEMIKGNKAPLHPFRADAWSFAMICSEILSRKAPYDGLKPREFRDQISCTNGNNAKCLRPNLPNNFEELTNLIQECWSQDPLQRPTFSNICERLTSLKKSFLKGTYSYEMVPDFGSPCTSRDSKLVMDHVQKV